MHGKTAHLIELAKDNSVAGRTRLVDETANELLHQPRDFSQSELQLFGQIFAKLYEFTHEETKHQLANTIALSDWAPLPLVRAIAMDNAHLAGPVLSFSPVITDEVLREVVETSSLEHQLRVADRPHIGQEVTSALIDNEHIKVIETLGKNPTASISSKAMEKAFHIAKDTPHILDAFSTRGDVTPELLKKAADLGANGAKKQLMNTSSQSYTPKSINEISSISERMSNINREFDPKYVRELIHVGDKPTLLKIFSQHLNMPPNQVAAVLSRNKIELYALLSRSIGLDPNNVEEFTNVMSNFTIEWRSEFNKAMISLWVKYTPAAALQQFMRIA